MPEAAHRQDLSELVNNPPNTTEAYWYTAASLTDGLGSHVVRRTKEQTRQHLMRVEHVEKVYGAALPHLGPPPGWYREQLRVRANREKIEVPVVDLNTVALHYGSETSLHGLSKGPRRAAAAGAYNSLGALNYAHDVGLYMGALLPSIVMKSPPEQVLQEEGLEIFMINELLAMREDWYDSNYSFGGYLDRFRRLSQEQPHQPGRLSFASAILTEMAEYFIDFEEHSSEELENHRITDSAYDPDYIAEAALLVAGHITDETAAGANLAELGINKTIIDQIRRRRYDIEFLDLYRRTKHGYSELLPTQREYEAIQLRYIDEFEQWMGSKQATPGIAFEWLATLVLRHYVYRNDYFGRAYVVAGAPRSDYPEDNLKGNATSRSQSHDVQMKLDGNRYFYQCKLKSSNKKYADPPIYMYVARAALGLDQQRPDFIQVFKNITTELRQIYEKGSGKVSGLYDLAELEIMESLERAA